MEGKKEWGNYGPLLKVRIKVRRSYRSVRKEGSKVRKGTSRREKLGDKKKDLPRKEPVPIVILAEPLA